jgi:hypothetical protein
MVAIINNQPLYLRFILDIARNKIKKIINPIYNTKDVVIDGSIVVNIPLKFN